jgi:UDP-2-acetamido-2,6-beta-L-arabino-hexul-4-ose reductase
VNVLITGAQGFLGRNLLLHLAERKDVHASVYTRGDDPATLPALVAAADFIFHLAGVNRPQDPAEFESGNTGLTELLCQTVAAERLASGRRVPVICTSSTQAGLDNPYGHSKRKAEQALFDLQRQHGIPVHLFRLPNVFGKWSRPHYNSAVATFCHQIARGLPIQINDPTATVTLVYVDDVMSRFLQLMDGADAQPDAAGFEPILPQYSCTVGQLAGWIESFRQSRDTLTTERVGTGLLRALYATYVSYLPTAAFAYPVPQHSDARGTFVEMLKTPDCGQFSFFTAHPGVTRGGHYHHTKTEKFLVIRGQACFKFRHMDSGETYSLQTSGDKAEIVETVPGWTHDITNTGSDEMVVMLWANEIFDRSLPDTYANKV